MTIRGSIIGLAVLGIGLVAARPARACGGFFCGTAPIDQSAEHIAFDVTTDASGLTTVNAIVQISYTGNAHDFAWVVPLHVQPTLSVGTSTLFTYLDSISQPQWTLDLSGQCGGFGFGESNTLAPTAGAAQNDTNGGGVTVVAQEDVGPYDAAILQATDATALTNWLQTNGYNLTSAGSTALGQYVGQNYFFVALKLQPSESTGDLRPIVLTMTGATPCIPIRLTAIAAQTNMPILAYFFSSGRGVPTNYRTVVVNEERIDWLNFGQNYTQLATEAIQEAGGQAFITEFAGATSALLSSQQPLYNGQFNTAMLATITDQVAFVQALIDQGYPAAQLLSLLEKYVPEPASLVGTVTPQQFYNSIQQYSQAIQDDPGRAPFNPTGFAADIQTDIVAPLETAQAMLTNSPYTTRLYTTMSPANMTIDPEFAFNTGLGDVSNIHTAKGVCLSSNSNSPIQITLSDGRTFTQDPGGALPGGPAAGIIEQLGATGQPTVISDNINTAKGCQGCSSADLGPAGLGLLAALLGRRRRRT